MPLRIDNLARAHSFAVAIALIALGTLRIAATYPVFTHTIDEPVHIACGMEWLSNRTYRYEAQHPPLARILAAALPYLAGDRSRNRDAPYSEGLAILYDNHRYQRVLTLARIGILPFFWLASMVTYWWTRRSFGDLAAVFATLLVTFTPPVLAHAGLATTDMALTATLGAAFLAMLVWIENPSWKWTAIFGIAIAATVLSKFSSLLFLPAAAVFAAAAWAIARRYRRLLKKGTDYSVHGRFSPAQQEPVGGDRAVCPLFPQTPRPVHLAALLKSRLPRFAAALLIAFLVVWAGYRFSFDKIPAPALFAGITDVVEHNRSGHSSYFLGRYSESGFRLYYPVVLAVKTPLPLFALAAIGLWTCWKRRKSAAYLMPVAFAAGVLATAFFSRINIGVRHVLPVYLAFAILGGIGAAALFESSRGARWILTALMAWMLATSAFAHPDYLAYFNALAGAQPEKIVVDSDLDWGQDINRLSKRLQQLGATQVSVNLFFVGLLEDAHGFPPVKPFDPNGPIPGWNAVGLSALKIYDRARNGNHPELLWPEHMRPTERVGKSILLFYIPPAR